MQRTVTQIARSAPVASTSRSAIILHRSPAPFKRTLWSSSTKPSSTSSTAEPDAQLRAEQSADSSSASSSASAETVTPSESDFADAAASPAGAAGAAGGSAAAGSTASGSTASGSVDAHAAALEAKDREIARLKDVALRSRADFENLQTQTNNRVQEAKDFAVRKLAADLISDLDILDIALKSVPEAARSGEGASSGPLLKDLWQGVSMTHQGVERTLGRFGITAFDPTGEMFNPSSHEALYQAPVPDKKPGSVLECAKKGWMIKSRVLRPAQVGVVQGSS